VKKSLEKIKHVGFSVIIEESAWRIFYKKYLGPSVIFVVFVPVMTVLFVLKSAYRIIFYAMIIWRAYKSYVQIDFIVFLNRFFHEFGSFFTWSEEIFRVLCFPVVYLVENLSKLSVNPVAVHVTCTGAQTPVYLFIDMLFLFMVVIFIESDALVFWNMMFTKSMGKISSMIFNKNYFKSNIFSRFLYVATAALITLLPDPNKVVQYCMGFIVYHRLFSISQNCDRLTNIPFESISAYFWGISAFVLFPVGETFEFFCFSVHHLLFYFCSHLYGIGSVALRKKRVSTRDT